jgi:succinate dehydrogenase / fumarate reductase cytochrome b subunit
MVSTSIGLRAKRAPSFWQSTNGKKIVMGVTGAILLAFVTGHMLGNLQIFAGPEHLNAYGHLLHSVAELLWPVRIALLAAVALHILAAVQLWQLNQKARPVSYARKEAIAASYASRTMYWSGPIVLAFLIFHLLQFTAGIIHPGSQFIEGDVYHNVVAGFQVWWVSSWYIFAVSLLGLHLSHGISAMFQSLGLSHPRYTPLLNKAAVAIAVVIVLGFISVPISVLLEVVK